LESQIDNFEAELEGLSVKKGKSKPPRLVCCSIGNIIYGTDDLSISESLDLCCSYLMTFDN